MWFSQNDFDTEWKLLIEKHGIVLPTRDSSATWRILSRPAESRTLAPFLSRHPPLGIARGGLLAYVPPVGGTNEELVKAGGRLVLGSDVGSTSSIPGFAVHAAIENLVKYGLFSTLLLTLRLIFAIV